jgi:hypothetical protein
MSTSQRRMVTRLMLTAEATYWWASARTRIIQSTTTTPKPMAYTRTMTTQRTT